MRACRQLGTRQVGGALKVPCLLLYCLKFPCSPYISIFDDFVPSIRLFCLAGTPGQPQCYPFPTGMFLVRLMPGSLTLRAQIQGISRAPLDCGISIHTSSVHLSQHWRAASSCQMPVRPEQQPVCQNDCGHCGECQSVLGTMTRAFWLNPRISSVSKAKLATIASFE